MFEGQVESNLVERVKVPHSEGQGSYSQYFILSISYDLDQKLEYYI